MNTYVESIISNLGESWQPLVRKVLQDCMAPPRGEVPFDEDEMNLAAYEIANAINDCAALDTWDGGEFFTERFRAALIEPRAYAGLGWKIRDLPLDGRKTKPLIAALRQGADSFEMARAIHDLKERVRDGLSVAESIDWIGSRLPTIAGANEALGFFTKKLPDALREMAAKPHLYGRGMKGWVNRAWIPLALWLEVHDPQKIHSILDRARKCYPPTRSMRFEYQADFLPAWSKIKPTKRQQVSRLPKG